jgi:WD40 repeat protein
MIRFVYPNINEEDQFAGCGRYFTTSPDDPALKQGYSIADPNVGHLSQIMTAVSILARESFDSDQDVYEYKDDPSALYLGDSMGLAYLLALIKRSRRTRWDESGMALDIWCTGAIEMSGEMPVLKNVYRNLFDQKLEAFLADVKDNIFIVPVANIEPKHNQVFRRHDAVVLSVEQFATCPVQEFATRKTIVKVYGNELELLVKTIFPPLKQPAAIAPVIGANPYRGLFAFREEDADVFFGREMYVTQLVNAVQKKPCVAVIGASGSGKTSLVYAGLIPCLRHQIPSQIPPPLVGGAGGGGTREHETPRRQGWVIPSREGQGWVIPSFRPGEHPFSALSSALIPLLEPDLDEIDRIEKIKKLAQKLTSGDLNLTDVLDAIAQKHPDMRLLIFVDQFEELYTLCQDEDERHRFLDELSGMTGVQTLVCHKLLLTMRADFLGKALAYRPFADVLQQAAVMLGPMNCEELRATIEKPAAQCGVTIEDGLIERILDAVGDEPGNLPLLEFALTEMWYKQREHTLTHAAYDDIGGVEHALADYAESVYMTLSAKEQQQAQHIFTQLVRPGEGTEDTRRVAARADIGAENWELVAKLADARLVVTNRSANFNLPDNKQTKVCTPEEVVEVVHEALITTWQRLREWIEADREFRMWQERLRGAMRQWKTSAHDEGALLRGAPLAEAEGWLEEREREISPDEQRFIQAGLQLRDQEFSEREAQRQRELDAAKQLQEAAKKQAYIQRKAAHRSKVFSVLIGIVALIAVFLWIQADKQYQRAERKTIEALGVSAKTLFLAHDGLGAMVAIVKAGKILQHADAPDELRELVLANFQMIVNTIHEKNRLEAHTAPVVAVSFSPDGAILASGSADGIIILWHVADGSIIRTLQGHTGTVSSLDFSPDDTMLVSGSFDKTIKLWNSLDGREIRTLQGHSGFIYGVHFSPDGKTLASASHDQSIKLWDVTTGNEIRTLRGHTDAVSCVEFSPDGEMLASGSDDQTIKLWNVAEGREIRTLQGHAGFVYSVRFSPDGKMLASASHDQTIKFWNVATGSEIATLQGHSDFISSVDFRPDGLILASGGNDKTVKLWSVENGLEINTLWGHTETVNAVRFNADGGMLASSSGDTTIRLWELNKGILEASSLDELLSAGCEWIQGYLKTNPNVSQQDRALCEDILR